MSIEFAQESSIRDQVLSHVSLAIAAFVLVVAATNFLLTKDCILGAIEILIALTFSLTYRAVKSNRKLTWHPVLIAAFVTAGLLWGFYHAKPGSAIAVWLFALPPLYLLLFNRLVGSLLSMLMLIATTLIFAPIEFALGTYPQAFINFLLPYCIIWIISYNHESVRLKVQKKLERLAKTDALTGALNLLALRENTDSKRYSGEFNHLLHFDLDHFKKINDTYGHSAGDRVLKSVVLIAMEVDKGKVYRLGGEEFCIVFYAQNASDAWCKAESFRSEVEQLMISYENQNFGITLSGGLIKLPLNCSSRELDKALQKTDRALYKAKDTGRNQIVVA